jgi:hypothetical protein
MEAGTSLKSKYVALAVLTSFVSQPTLAAPMLSKQRGPLDKYRQFTSHFEFATPRPVVEIRTCILDAIKQAAVERKEPEPVFKLKQSKKGGDSVENYSWKIKFRGYNIKYDVYFRFSDHWTHVDVDPVFSRNGWSPDSKIESSFVAVHNKCGLAADRQGFDNGIPRVLAHIAGEPEPAYSATLPLNMAQAVHCLSSLGQDMGSHWLDSTIEADHLGNFYIYYIENYKNLGATVRTHYAVRIKPDGAGTRFDIVMPGVSIDNFVAEEAERSLFPAKKGQSCGATRQPKSA